jgi:protoheme IX farnesyltransferase
MPAVAERPLRTRPAPRPVPAAAVETPSRLADYLELTKPRIATMALVTVAVGYLLGAGAANFRLDVMLHTLVGAGLVAAGGSALNHWWERRADSRMKRTANRPLPSGRLSSVEVLTFGVSLAVAGVVYLAVAGPNRAAAAAAGLTFFLYVFVYTPLKQLTAWNTVVGAVPGALPPVIGWCAARGDLTADAAGLFLILFIWQLPHFYSIAWLYRADYARGGMRMLPVVDRPDGFWTGRACAATAGLLVLVATIPYFAGTAGWVYLAGAVPVSLWFFARCVRFAADRTDRNAKRVLRGSLVHLVAVMALFVLDGVLPRYLG